jgi:hypothetical protein
VRGRGADTLSPTGLQGEGGPVWVRVGVSVRVRVRVSVKVGVSVRVRIKGQD